jgi:alkaline phosphatase D
LAEGVYRRRLLGAGAGFAAAALSGCALPLSLAPSESSTAKKRHPNTLNRIAFGSCIDQTKPQPIWSAINASKPDLFIFGGDNIYASDQPWRLDKLQSAYAQLAQNAGFSQLRDTTPYQVIWDDHDMGLNDGGADFPHIQASKDEFLKFWNLAATDPRRTRDGLYHSEIYGNKGQQVQVILLDCRSFRSPLKPTDVRNAAGKERYLPDADPTKTMLGAAQWQWLEQQLMQPADVRLIVSGVQVIVEGHGWESWANFPAEQAKLINLIRSTQAKGVLFLSGDRHIGAMYKHLPIDVTSKYPLYELTSSGMTHAWATAKEAGPNRLGELVTQNHFAQIDIDWTARNLSLSLIGEQGQRLKQLTIALSDLS